MRSRTYLVGTLGSIVVALMVALSILLAVHSASHHHTAPPVTHPGSALVCTTTGCQTVPQP